MIIITFGYVPLTVIFWNLGTIFAYIGINPGVAAIVGNYCKILSWGFYMDSLFQSMRMYLLYVQTSAIPTLIQLLTVLIHPFWCWLFYSHLNYGIYGCAIA